MQYYQRYEKVRSTLRYWQDMKHAWEMRNLYNIFVGKNEGKRMYGIPLGSRGSSVSIVSGYGLDDRAIEVRSPAGARISSLTSVSRPALGPTQPPVQWVPGVLSLGVKRGRGVTLTTHPI
jgi:hypothetical protein